MLKSNVALRSFPHGTGPGESEIQQNHPEILASAMTTFLLLLLFSRRFELLIFVHDVLC